MDSHDVIEMKSEEENWEISRENIRILTIVGEGSFGQVAKGLLIHKTMENEQTEVVAIKMVKGQMIIYSTIIFLIPKSHFT